MRKIVCVRLRGQGSSVGFGEAFRGGTSGWNFNRSASKVVRWDLQKGLNRGDMYLTFEGPLHHPSLSPPPRDGYNVGIYTYGSRGGCTETINAYDALGRLRGRVSCRVLLSSVPEASIGRICAQ
ncbi:hypothetical protein GW17_00035601 [Ensete ventricosum]|nr:hypothetical protein GW17_00035601 [Ensete ventricosum]